MVIGGSFGEGIIVMNGGGWGCVFRIGGGGVLSLCVFGCVYSLIVFLYVFLLKWWCRLPASFGVPTSCRVSRFADIFVGWRALMGWCLVILGVVKYMKAGQDFVFLVVVCNCLFVCYVGMKGYGA